MERDKEINRDGSKQGIRGGKISNRIELEQGETKKTRIGPPHDWRANEFVSDRYITMGHTYTYICSIFLCQHESYCLK